MPRNSVSGLLLLLLLLLSSCGGCGLLLRLCVLGIRPDGGGWRCRQRRPREIRCPLDGLLDVLEAAAAGHERVVDPGEDAQQHRRPGVRLPVQLVTQALGAPELVAGPNDKQLGDVPVPLAHADAPVPPGAEEQRRNPPCGTTRRHQRHEMFTTLSSERVHGRTDGQFLGFYVTLCGSVPRGNPRETNPITPRQPSACDATQLPHEYLRAAAAAAAGGRGQDEVPFWTDISAQTQTRSMGGGGGGGGLMVVLAVGAAANVREREAK